MYTDVHIEGLWEPVKVKRHEKMTKQFSSYVDEEKDVPRWLVNNTNLINFKGKHLEIIFNLLSIHFSSHSIISTLIIF